MRSPLVSVVVPTFNREGYLPLAIESVLRQTGVVVDVVIVDDGSTDGTSKVVERNKASWGDRVRYVWQPNAERCVARNHGLRLSRGEFVAFLDSDDIWLPDHLHHCLETFAAHPHAVAVYGEYGLISATGGVLRDRIVRPRTSGKSFLRNLCLKRVILHPTGVVVRHAVLDGGDPFDPEIPGAEDWLFWVSLARRGLILGTSRRTVWMRVHPGGTFGEPYKFSRSLTLAAEKVIKSGLPASLGISDGRVRAINQTHCAYAHYLSGHWRESFRYLSRAIRTSPAALGEPDFWRVLARLSVGKTLSRRIRAARHGTIRVDGTAGGRE